ncbi:hypothetical protein [Myxococcus sp. NMCA1]|uniref:hypothetical protein n=1 Tax=Myxococcus sp. NMCA1 TaxID=2996785 RepID=UPI0022857FB7|nr:hypothetical protein [Myxococcus sp. NMCA1]WAM23838.1 hypothetical protein OZ403_25185 [Myxococcus sp. NMCA1]
MFVDKQGMPTDPTLDLPSQTLVFDRKRQRNIAWLNGLVSLPVGTEIELVNPNITAVVTGNRLFLGHPGGDSHAALPTGMCIDVEVPEEWWNEAS